MKDRLMAVHIFVIFLPYTFVDGINLNCWPMATGWDSAQNRVERQMPIKVVNVEAGKRSKDWEKGNQLY